MAYLKFAIRALTTEEATDRKNQGSGGAIPPEPCAFSASLWVCFHGDNLLLHFPNQLGQFFLTFLLGTGVDVAGHAFSADGGGVAAFPEMVVDLADTAGAGLAALALVGLEGGRRRDSWRRVNLLGGFTFGDPTVDLILMIWTKSLHHSLGLRSRRAIQSPKRLQQAQQILSVAISTTGANEVWDTSLK